MNLKKTIAWLNRTYPDRDWNQRCQQLVWNVIHYAAGIPESEMVTYPTATAARVASTIESTDASAAPAGAIHYWKNPAEGHVGVSLGGELVLMTGTPYALGEGGQQAGTNYGITTVTAYTRRMGNPYLGWSRRNGRNASIITDKKPIPAPTPTPKPAGPTLAELEERDDIMNPRLIARVDKNGKRTEWTLIHPSYGPDLAAGESRVETIKLYDDPVETAQVTVRPGQRVTKSERLGDAWGRTHCRPYGNAPLPLTRDKYMPAQEAAEADALDARRAERSEIIGSNQ